MIKIVRGDFAKAQAGLFYPKRRGHHFIDAFSRPVPFGHAVPDLFALGLNFFQQLFLVEAQIPAVVHQRLPVHDDRANVGQTAQN